MQCARNKMAKFYVSLDPISTCIEWFFFIKIPFNPQKTLVESARKKSAQKMKERKNICNNKKFTQHRTAYAYYVSGKRERCTKIFFSTKYERIPYHLQWESERER